MWARSRMRVMVWPRFLGQLAHYETIGLYRRSAWWHEGGRYQIAWDGLDEAGKPLERGLAQDDADEVARISEDGQSGGTSRSAWVVRFVYRYLK